ncbi:MAG: RNA methyltransferase [Hyphomicrobiales bacterium]|nr:RNA methyltransferase [Hyphomicrobiales bacterium]MDE2114940.1 class I SAM-dependent RNA methyltransferase [Hyphomicrobiales bacterium]
MIRLRETLEIQRLGQRGEGVAGAVFVPFALKGETVIAEVDGERGTLVEVTIASPDRIAAFCPYFTQCGGCAVQTLAAPAYLEWKRGLLADALRYGRVNAKIVKVVDAHGAGRRRATFHARSFRDGRGRLVSEAGFMQARAHKIIEIDACPLFAPGLSGAIAAVHAIAKALAETEKPLDIVTTASLEGLDVDIRGCGPLNFTLTQKLVVLADELDIARISNHGSVLIERRAPVLAMGLARVVPPPGAFLQATEAGEATLADLVLAGIKGAKRVADLFAGIGTFALRIAEVAPVHAVESELSACHACEQAAHNAKGLKRLTVEARDLFRRPLTLPELAHYDAVVFDPPRAGAQAQVEILAKSAVTTVVAVSCNAQTFARDASILIAGGYDMGEVTPVDQFRHSAHIELVAIFRKKVGGAKKKRGLLS